MAVEVNPTGDASIARFTFEARPANGPPELTGNFLAIGTRLAVEPMVPVVTPPVPKSRKPEPPPTTMKTLLRTLASGVGNLRRQRRK
jgi:hypothetical protein